MKEKIINIVRRIKISFWKFRKEQTEIFNWNREHLYW